MEFDHVLINNIALEVVCREQIKQNCCQLSIIIMFIVVFYILL